MRNKDGTQKKAMKLTLTIQRSWWRRPIEKMHVNLGEKYSVDHVWRSRKGLKCVMHANTMGLLKSL